jgi:hypothetical protein
VAIILVIGVLNLASPDRTLRAEGEDEGATAEELDAVLEAFDVSAGIGVYLVLLGAVLAAAATGFAFAKLRQRPAA